MEGIFYIYIIVISKKLFITRKIQVSNLLYQICFFLVF